MKKTAALIDIIIIAIMILLIIVTVAGLCSFNTTKSYEVVNQYGDTVKMWGSGIYEHDSYFKAPILIGSDTTMLIITLPLLIVAFIKEKKSSNSKTKLFLASAIAVVLYYSASIAFGVTYNVLQLLYIALFSCALFAFIVLMSGVDQKEIMEKQAWELPTRGISWFLLVSGAALFIAWLPDIIPTFFNGKSLSRIEVYTTEITYVLDMGILSPAIFLCLYQLKHNNSLGYLLLPPILLLCSVVGIMVILQSAFQIAARIDVPLGALITKTGIFVVLSAFATYFMVKYNKKLEIGTKQVK